MLVFTRATEIRGYDVQEDVVIVVTGRGKTLHTQRLLRKHLGNLDRYMQETKDALFQQGFLFAGEGSLEDGVFIPAQSQNPPRFNMGGILWAAKDVAIPDFVGGIATVADTLRENGYQVSQQKDALGEYHVFGDFKFGKANLPTHNHVHEKGGLLHGAGQVSASADGIIPTLLMMYVIKNVGGFSAASPDGKPISFSLLSENVIGFTVTREILDLAQSLGLVDQSSAFLFGSAAKPATLNL